MIVRKTETFGSVSHAVLQGRAGREGRLSRLECVVHCSLKLRDMCFFLFNSSGVRLRVRNLRLDVWTRDLPICRALRERSVGDHVEWRCERLATGAPAAVAAVAAAAA